MEEKKQNVACTAEDCVFNHKTHCTAEHINVNGRGAKQSCETECETFCGKDCHCND